MSTIKVDTVQSRGGGAVTLTNQDAAKCWVFVTQSSATIESSFNVASATDGGTGLTSITLTNAFSSANISGTFGHGNKSTSNPGQNLQAMCGTDASNTYGIEVERSDTSANADASGISLHLMGDLA